MRLPGRVHAFGSHTVESPGILVGSLAKFSPRVQVGQNQFNRGYLEFGMNIDWDAASVVSYGAGPICVESHLHGIAVAGQVLVDGVVQDLVDTVVESALIWVSDIHARTLANGLESLKFIDLRGIVNFSGLCVLGGPFGRRDFFHRFDAFFGGVRSPVESSENK